MVRGMITAANPATLSSSLCGLFPVGAIAAELRQPGDAALLLPAEAAHLGRAVPKRIQEFAAGRLCARRAMAELGVGEFALRVADDRQPVWPDFIVGSITHTAGLCAAAVAHKRRMAALGMDSEVVGGVTRDIWPKICGPKEWLWLGSLPAPEQPAAVTLIFSAKEAFYKCQYPMVGERLDFHDLLVEPLGWGARTAAFRVQATRRLAFADRATLPMQGRYLFHEQFVSAGIAVPAPDASAQ
jgi:4'-phosphopantetheinyl transferase EntD